MDADFIAIGYIFILISIPILTLSLRFGGLTGAFVAIGILSLIVAVLLAFIQGYANAWKLHNNFSSEPFFLQMPFIGFVGSCCLLLFISYGLNQLIVFNQTGQINKVPFFIWLGLIVGIPSSYHFKNYWHDHQQKKHFAEIKLKLSSPVGLPIYLDSIVFINSKNDRQVSVLIDQLLQPHFEQPLNLQDGFRASTEQRPRDLAPLIPKGADKFIASWYSYAEGKFYQDEFPLPDNVFETPRLLYSDNWYMGPIYLRIYRDGVVDLFNDNQQGRSNIQNYFSVAVVQPSAEVQKRIDQFKLQLRGYPDFNSDVSHWNNHQASKQRPLINKSSEFFISLQSEDKRKFVSLTDVHTSTMKLSATKPRQRMYSKSVPWAVKSSFYQADSDRSIVFTIYFEPDELYGLTKYASGQLDPTEIDIVCDIKQRSPAQAICYALIAEQRISLKHIFVANSHE